MTTPQTPWHAATVAETKARLQTDEQGLASQEARRRRDEHGLNEIEQEPPTSPWIVFLRQFKSPLIYILLLAAIVTIAIGEYVDAGVIAAVLAINAIIGFTQERRAETAVRALSQLVSPRAHIVRDGHEDEIDSRELVPGDLVLLESGARVPADIRLASANNLSIDESLLTGESVPVEKRTEPVDAAKGVADRRSLAFTGSVVARGRGRGYVVATGARTELGAIADSLRGEERGPTPLQVRMARFAQIVTIVIGVASAASFVIGVVMGRGMTEMFTVAVALAVAAIPEGLPVALTVTLAVGVRRMAKQKAIIRSLPAVETLGSTTVIGSDKTGTLTQNRMTVERIWSSTGEALDIDPTAPVIPHGAADHSEVVRRTLLAGALTNEGEFFRTIDGFETRGDPTETALLAIAARLGIDPDKTRLAHPSVIEVPFEPEQQYSASLRSEDDGHVLYVKGAPEKVLSMSNAMMGPDGSVPLDHDAIAERAAQMAAHGLRVLAMAYRLDADHDVEREDVDVEDLCFLGLVGMMDPPRPEVHDAIAGCQRAGIRVLMITGDHAATARAIAFELGIVADENAPVLRGADLDRIDDEELARRVREVSVYARVAPEQKLRVVRTLQALGEIVAVTGDGVNDAPALQAAEIGIAMGKSGTDVARAASDMVLADDNFVSIKAAVEQGRITFNNIRKVTFFLVSSGAAFTLTILATLLVDWPIPYVAAQLLWLNLVTNGLQDVALAFEPGDKGVLDDPPRSKREGILSPLLWWRTVLAGLVMSAGILWMFHWELQRGGSLEQARTVAMTTMVFFQMFHVGNARSDTQSLFTMNPFSNRFLFIATLTALLVHVASLYIPATQFVLRVEPITDLWTWARMVGVAFSVVIAVELHKLLHRLRKA